jgi:hypothetical protein
MNKVPPQRANDGTRMFTFPDAFNDYKDLIYVPLDLEVPQVDEGKFLSWFETTHDADMLTGGNEVNGIQLTTEYSKALDPAKNSKNEYPWNIVYLHRAGGPTRNLPIFYNLFPMMRKFIETLPFDKKGIISILRQHPGIDVGPHTDFDLWFGIRFYLINKSNAKIFFQKAKNPSTLRLSNWTNDGKKVSWDGLIDPEKIYATYPDPICSFHITSTHAVHGVEAVPEDIECSRITFFFTGKLNEIKYKKLLDRSLAKYGDHAIWW